MLNKKDMQIITNLRQDARMNLTKMSRSTGIPVSTIFDRIKSYRNDIITKNTALIDFEKLGFNTRAKIIVKIARDDKAQFSDFIMRDFSINSVYRINNGFDFMIEAIFHNIKEMEEFIDKIEDKFKIENINYFYIIDDLKRESFLTDLSLL